MEKAGKSSEKSFDSKRKILHVVEAMGSGVFTYIVDLANQLCNEFDVHIAYGVRPQTPEDYREYFDKRIKLIEVKNFTRSINPIKDAKAFLEIRKIARVIEPDIIHLHSSKAGALGRWALNIKNYSLYYTPHGYSFLMQDCGAIKRNIYRVIESVSGKRGCTTIACSKGEYEESLSLAKNVTYINNGINVNELQELVKQCSTTDAPHPLTVFTLGRICYQKNPELFNMIAEKVPDVRFVWIGDGELRGKLTSSNIEVTGWINRKSALEYSVKADVFILPSLWEGLPISLLEAMYMKKLSLVSDINGNRDVIENGVNGFVCRSADEYAEIIQNRKSSPYQSVIEKAYQDILHEYNTTVMVEEYKKIYLRNIRKSSWDESKSLASTNAASV